jgi:hypothetical protein
MTRPPPPDPLLQEYDQVERALADDLGVLYAAAYAGTPQGSDPFYSGARFAERLAG